VFWPKTVEELCMTQFHMISTTYHLCISFISGLIMFHSPSGTSDYEYEWGGQARQPLHHDNFLICCAFTISSLPPVVPYLQRSTISCIKEPYHGHLVPWNVYISDEVLIQLNPHTHIRYVSLFRLGCFFTTRSLYASGTALPRTSSWASSWYLQTTWSYLREAFLP
jgi:hypothetical protein